MAKIRLKNIAHSYMKNPQTEEDFALRELDMEWQDGKAYALLGPSGCGKSTLLNIISGLLTPSHGEIYFDGKEVTYDNTAARNIAQVFQFPVVYDTMTVYDNLSFPLKNQKNKHSDKDIDKKVRDIAEMLGLTDTLNDKAKGLSADAKQTISLGRGLVRDDVNAILFDEPLTVIDPHLKWKLRSKLKYLHKKFDNTMIYVTHDQTEALTFADEVVVMSDGEVVQLGTPEALFEKPEHTFVGYFIGSPGMNILPAHFESSNIVLTNQEKVHLDFSYDITDVNQEDKIELGIRPEFLTILPLNESEPLPKNGFKGNVLKVEDVGRHQVVRVEIFNQTMNVIVEEHQLVECGEAIVVLNAANIHLYQNGWRMKSLSEKTDVNHSSKESVSNEVEAQL